MIANIFDSSGKGTPAAPSDGAARTLRVLLVDDHSIVRFGIRQLIEREFSPVECGEAENGDKAIEIIRRQPWDIVLLDLSMPGCSGMDVLRRLSEMKSRVAVLVVSMHSEEEFGIQVLKEGAAGFVAKTSSNECIVNAIRKAVSGQKYISGSLAERLAMSLGNENPNTPHEALSEREAQVMRMIGAGKSVKEIGFELGLSSRTISTYRVRLLAKLDLRSNAEIIRYVLSNKLIL